MNTSPQILIYAPSANGGIAEHVYYQAQALHQRGALILVLVSPGFLKGRKLDFPVARTLADSPARSMPKLFRRVRQIWCLVANPLWLAWEIFWRRPVLVLLDSYSEYLAPVWIWPHLVLSQLFGIKYAANLHDPVRSTCVGPLWWHRLSVRLAYVPLDFVLVHDRLPEPSPVPPAVRTVQVPVGVYEVRPAAPADRIGTRRKWGVRESQAVLLAFGQVRDNKNLDLCIKALAANGRAFFVLAGEVASDRDRPFAYYRDLAARLGVGDRCHFHEGFIADDKIETYFSAADIVVLTYWSKFQSQSGVLNIAARCRKQVLASSGPGPLIDAVRQFRLGIAVEPDSVTAVEGGICELLDRPPDSQWQEYENHASWEANAAGIIRAAQSKENFTSESEAHDGTARSASECVRMTSAPEKGK